MNTPVLPRLSRRRAPRLAVAHGVGFWVVAAAFAILMAFGTAPTPLWPLYQQRDGFDATMATTAFAMLVVGAAASLFFCGHLSDRYGRRRIIFPALVIAFTAALILALWPDLPGLLVGRVLTGVAVGLMASTATTYLADLYRQEHPDKVGSHVPATVSTAANLGGLALGPLLVGALAQWAPAPLTTPFVVFAALLFIALLLVLASPETVDRELQSRQRPARFALHRGARGAFVGAAVVGFCSFTALGMFSALGSIVIHGDLGITSHFIGGLAAFTVLALSALTQLALRGLTVKTMLRAGATTLTLGMALVCAAMYHPSLCLYLLGAAVAGAGTGMLFKGAITTTASVALPASRAGVLSVYFVVAYIGMGAPSIILAAISRVVDPKVAMVGFAAVLSVGAAAAIRVALTGNTLRRSQSAFRTT